MLEILSLGVAFFAGHVASEAIVDRVPQLRAVCRGITQMDTASIIKDYVSEAVREAIYPEKSKKKNLEEA